MTSLRAGAALRPIELPVELFPVDGFEGVHDAVHVRCLVLDDGDRQVLVWLELPSLRDYEVVRLISSASRAAAATRDRVWVGVSHTLGAPHVRSQAALADPDVARRNAVLCAALEEATAAAVEEAASRLAPCMVGTAATSAPLTVNRDRLTHDGWTHDADPSRYSDHTLTVVRIDGVDGAPVAVLFGCDLRPSLTEHADGAGHGPRLVSGDCVGAASRVVESRRGGVALFLPGAMADQVPSLRSLQDVPHDPYEAADALGRVLGTHVLSALAEADVAQVAGVGRRGAVVDVPLEGHPGALGLELDVLTLGSDLAILGLKPELTSALGTRIRSASPWAHTLVCTMVNGGLKYLVDEQAREAGTRTAVASPFGAGAADRVVAAATALLHDAHHHEEQR